MIGGQVVDTKAVVQVLLEPRWGVGCANADELVGFGTTDGAFPAIREFGKGGSRGNVSFGIAFVWLINIATEATFMVRWCEFS